MVWQLTNSTPFEAEYTFARDLTGAELGLVVIKGTFTLNAEGEPTPAEKQAPITLAPEYLGEPGQSSLLYDWDFPFSKRTTDVLLNGHAYAPARRPTTEVDVRMKVGPIEKTLRVFGDRRWQKRLMDFTSSDPLPFLKMPIVYERAFGGGDLNQLNGWDGRNPLGTGFARDRDTVDAMRLPNIELPGELISSWKARPRPAGFGAIYPNWEPRPKFAGTYDEKWERERLPLLPLDFDDRFNQCAPADQQPSRFLRGGEPVELKNLTPTGSLTFKLPRVDLGLQTEIANKFVDHRAELYTVILEPDVPRVILVWQSAVQCKNKARSVVGTLIWQKPLVALRGSAGAGAFEG